MGDKDDYLTCYRVFFENFAATVNPEDQLPVNIAGYTITEAELPGEVIYWMTQYLTEKQCPPTLMTPLRRIILEDVLAEVREHPIEFGFHRDESVFIALRLMQAVMARVNAVCLRYLDNSLLDSLPPPVPLDRDSRTVAAAIKNQRRTMEDRHVVIGNLEALFGLEAKEPTSFFAVYDGHAGSAAATYCAAHLHQYLVDSPYFRTDLRRAMLEAFLRTDAEFVRKSNQQRACGGSTAVAVVVRGRWLLAAWAGDSLALLAKRMRLLQLVHPHKPDRQDERKRIESSGGTVMFYGTWRVNGQLAVSRAIGDAKYKPYVTARPEIEVVELDGDEDFVVVACDGLWDFVSEDKVALSIYAQLAADPDDLKAVTKRLIAQAKREGSPDNISVIVVFLKDPRDIVADTCPPMDLGLDNALSSVPPFVVEAEGRKPDAAAIAVQECTEIADIEADADNGVSDSDSEDFGPETAVDADEADADNDADTDARHHEPAAPTPPAHTAAEGHVDGVLVDNVAESGEDSEDEWNYYKGEGEPERDEHNPSEEHDEPPRSDTPCQDNSAWESSSADMNSSPLNPDAPVFVPGGVVGSDVLLAESPRKPLPMDDIDLPDVAQFQTEAVIRPAELLDLDNSDHLNGHHNVSIDSTKEQLNGNGKCDMESLGFGFNVNADSEKIKDMNLIQEFERIQKDTTDYCDIQVLQAHTETNPFDDRDDELFERLKNKERDPMSMSFYQEKDDDTCERFTKIEGHIDLNAVQPLPDSDDEDIQPNGDFNNVTENDKENMSPVHNTNLLEAEDIQEPNNDILKFDDRTENLVTNVTNLDHFMDYNINNSNNMQSYSNVEFECSNIPQDVLQTDTPESHKLLFEQIPEIPDGKSSELGFTNDDLQDRSESEKDTRVITPEDEVSQDIEVECERKLDSPITDTQTDFIEANIKEEEDTEIEKDIQFESDLHSEDGVHEATLEITSDMNRPASVEEPALFSQSVVIDQTEAIMHQVPNDTEQTAPVEISNEIKQKLEGFDIEIKDTVSLNEINDIEADECGYVEKEKYIEFESDIQPDDVTNKFTSDFTSNAHQLGSMLEPMSPPQSQGQFDETESITHGVANETEQKIQVEVTKEEKDDIAIEDSKVDLVNSHNLQEPQENQFDIEAEFTEVQDVMISESPLPAELPVVSQDIHLPSESDALLHIVSQDIEFVTQSPLPVESPQPVVSTTLEESPLPVESPTPVESPLPVQSPVLMESALPVDSSLPVKSPIESPVPIESPLPDALQSADNIAIEELKANEFSVTKETGEFLGKESPLPAESPLPTRSPLPTESPLPTRSPLTTESPLPTETPLPAESPQPTETALPVESPLPTGSPLPTESSQISESPEAPNEHLLSKSPLPVERVSPLPTESIISETTLPIDEVPQDLLPENKSPTPYEESQLMEQIDVYGLPISTEKYFEKESISQIEVIESVGLSHQPETKSPAPPEISTEAAVSADSLVCSVSPATSPVPAKSPALIYDDVHPLDINDKVADLPNESRLTPEVQQETIPEPVSDIVPHSETIVAEPTGPTPDLVPDERVDVPQLRTELVTDIDIGIPESRAQEICVPVTSEIQHDDAVQPSAGSPPPTPAVEPIQMAPSSLDIPPISETSMAADATTVATSIAAGTAIAAAAVATMKAKSPVTKKSPTTPTARTPKPAPKSTATSRTPASSVKKTATASPAMKTPTTPKPTAAKTSISAKTTPTTKAAAKPSTPSSKPTTPAAKPATKPAPALAKEAPAVAKAAPVRTATRPPAKPASAKPASAPVKTSTTAAAKPAAPRPITRPATARPASAVTVAAAAAKPKVEAKPKPAAAKPLMNGDVKAASKAPTTKPAVSARTATKPAPKPAPRAVTTTAAPANAAPAKPTGPRATARPLLDKQSKDLANKRITAKAAPPRTVPAKAPISAKSAALKSGPRKVEIPKKVEAPVPVTNGCAPAKLPPSPPPADNALLPDVIA